MHTGNKGNSTSVIYITFPDISMIRTFYNSHVGIIKMVENTSKQTYCAPSIYDVKSHGPQFVSSGSLFT